MGLLDTRTGRLTLLLAAVLVLTLIMVADVLGALFFAVTIAYVLLPVKRRLVRRGLSDRVGAGIVTSLAFLAGAAVVGPLLFVVYRRRGVLLDYLRALPDEFVFEVFEFRYVLEVDTVVPVVQDALASAAIAIATSTPLLLVKVFLFTFVVYALTLRPAAVRESTLRAVPESHREDALRFHRRVRSTLFGIYVVQAATAAGTFLVALVVFFLLGYDAYFTFAVVSGLLQFIPIVGPSILIVAIGAAEFVGGNPGFAAVTIAVGLVVIGVLPDLILRPRIARRTADMAASLYFVGFIAGGLSFGAVGVIAGPVVMAVLVEAVDVVSESRTPVVAERTPAAESGSTPPAETDPE